MSETALEVGVPRTLKAFGAFVMNDLDESQITTLIDDGIDIVEDLKQE
ncbi:MAG: hypothetical protein WBC85_04115 [Planktotalea sp.]